MADKNNDLAESRTDWAEDRTILANERTFAGWMRTGMACIGIALGLKAIFGELDPTWLAKGISSLFLVISIAIFWAARQNSIKTSKRMTEHSTESQSCARMTKLATLLTLGSVFTGVVLWMI